MRKYTLVIAILFLVLISQKSNAQVGVNTESPSATLDIVSDQTDPNYAPLIFKNSDNQEILKTTNRGNFHFNKALMPDNDAGNSGDYLISQGADVPPVWGELQTENGVILIQEFNANNTNFSYVGTQSTATLNFSNINISPSPEIGSWNSSGKYFEVSKRGLYHITSGVELRNVRSTNSNFDPQIALYVVGDTFIQAAGNILYTEGTNQNMSTYGVLSVILNPGDRIRVILSTNSNTTTYIGNGYLNVQYSNID